MRPQLQEAARAIRAAGYRNVLVRGQMRLPCWFAAGAQLSEVAGFEVTSMQLGTLWSSADTDHVLDEPPTVLHDMVAGTGADLAIAMDPTPDVRAYLPAVPSVGRYIALSLGLGSGRQMITSSAHATATAVGSATWSDNSPENTVHNGCTCFSPSLTASPYSSDTSGTPCPPHWCTRTSAPGTPTSRPS